SMGLAIPYPLFQGELNFQTDFRLNQITIDNELKAFSKYLKNVSKNHDELSSFDADSFEFDVSQGLCFQSTIPQGYGVGSSGALCASVYHRYCADVQNESVDTFDKKRLSELKKIFSIMEAHFHGASSGIDPLISYVNQAVLIKGLNNVEIITDPVFKKKAAGGIFLLNTARPRRTEPLVNLFLEKCKETSFRNLCETILLPIINGCIHSFLSSDKNALLDFFQSLSDFQYRHFDPMIPHLFKEVWHEGLKSEAFYLKLCGAGGGGFLLGMTENFDEAKDKLQGYEIRPLYFL
ncbi:MAG: mevalonate kinase, partial [Bdellovibrionales bacterium RIFOXYB2_FULL_36_6]